MVYVIEREKNQLLPQEYMDVYNAIDIAYQKLDVSFYCSSCEFRRPYYPDYELDEDEDAEFIDDYDGEVPLKHYCTKNCRDIETENAFKYCPFN